MASLTPTYNSAFPALQSGGTHLPKRRQSHPISSLPPTFHRSLAPPKYPAYLKETLYGSLALEQYNYLQRKGDKPNSGLRNAPLLRNNEDNELDHLDLRLPTMWNAKDKSKNIEVGSNGQDLIYIGPGKTEQDAALARSNYPMRHQCGVFYFEMKVISKGNDGYIGIGFCRQINELERLPGWDANSWGYHGDDGHSFAGSGTGQNYGPCFSTGDVIGCGVNFADFSAFYTKNGKFLGTAFTNIDLSQPVYPAVGLRTPGEQVTVNFGYEPFSFDIGQYIKDQKIKFLQEITREKSKLSQDQAVHSKETLDQLVLSYLIHHGYTDTAKAVVYNGGHASTQDLSLSDSYSNISKFGEKDMEERQAIRTAIIKGHIDEAMQLIETYFPGVLQEEKRGKELLLMLKCRKFVEMIREYCEYNKQQAAAKDDVADMDNGIFDKNGIDINKDGKSGSMGEQQYHSISPSVSGGRRRPSYAAIAASLSPSNSSELMKRASIDNGNDESMDIDSENSLTVNSGGGHIWKKRGSVCSTGTTSSFLSTDRSMMDEEENTSQTDAPTLKAIMHYGQQLQDEYRNDHHEKTRSALVEIFSLLAYPDPYCSPVEYLLHPSKRDALATDVNAAILVFLHRPEMPALERIYSQAVLTTKELVYLGDGKSSLINISDYCAKKSNHHGSGYI